MTFSHPVEFKNISSGYGIRKDPFTGKENYHRGMDYLVPIGTPVKSSLNGIVYKIEYSNTGFGNSIIIKHENDFFTLYGHLSGITVFAGEKVLQGQTIGFSGSSGKSTGAHLHFAIKNKDGFQNPTKYLKYPSPLPPSIQIDSNPYLFFIPLAVFFLLKKS